MTATENIINEMNWIEKTAYGIFDDYGCGWYRVWFTTYDLTQITAYGEVTWVETWWELAELCTLAETDPEDYNFTFEYLGNGDDPKEML